MEFHSLLKRHLKKLNLTENEIPTVKDWEQFLIRVNHSFFETDQERYLLERSLMISSQEMQDVFGKLRESERRYELAERGANDGLWDWNLQNDEIYYSPRWMEILGIEPKPGQVSCKNCWLDRIHPSDRETVLDQFNAHIKGITNHFQNEHRVLHSDGDYRWVLIRGLAVRDAEGKAFRIAGSLTDTTERKQAEEKLAFDAIHDALTGLPNRKFLMDRLERSISRMNFGTEYSFATLFVDIDRFKTINDSMGHQAGDELLLHITKKINYLIRPSDMLARLGGDEFVLVIENAKRTNQVFAIADRIIKELQKPVTINGQEIFSSASIGIVFGSSEYKKAEDLVRDADLAMYRAKVKGKGRYELFESDMHVGALSQMHLEMDLRRAIEKEELLVHYQPIVSLDAEKIIGFEALARWKHSARGYIPPDDFIPLAEEVGLILPIGKWILEESCRQLKEWQDRYDFAKELVVHVNLSAVQLEQPDLAMMVESVLEKTGLEARFLKLEITESVIMKNAQVAIKNVSKLRKMGIKISIDDFGTGYSSLSYLHKFPIDTLKVDRSFINNLDEKNDNAEIVQTIIQLASNLGIDVIAEGVETAEQLKYLQEMECGFGQGFYYSKPLDHDAIEEMIKETEHKQSGLKNQSVSNNQYSNIQLTI